jgi:hypothetical protein
VVWRDVDGEIVLLNVVTGHYFGLDPVGSEAWRILQAAGDQGLTVTAWAETLRASYDVDADTAVRDLGALIDELAAQQLLIRT